MPSTGTILAAVAIIIIILIGAVVGLFYFMPSLINTPTSSTTTSPTSSTSSTSSTTTTSSSVPTTSFSSSSSTRSTTGSSSSSTKTRSSETFTKTSVTTRTNTTSYALQLVNSGSGPVLVSPMNTMLGRTYLPYDGPCCTEPPVSGGAINYTDRGNNWVLQGDIEPGTAWASANASGLTVSYDASQGGPNHEFWGDNEAFNDASIYGDLDGIPSNATVFSVDAYLPYHSYYANCQQDLGNGSSGCSYEVTPYDSAALALISSGKWVVVSFAEICNNNPCTTNGLQMTAYTSAGGANILNMLAVMTEPTYSPLHKLTIATDKKTFIAFYVDNILVYSNSTMPIDLSGQGSQIEISQRTSINNETSSVTWSNATAYAGSNISVSGLSRGMTVVVNGTGGFNVTAVPSSNGTAFVIVAIEPMDLVVSVELNGKLIATYRGSLEVGAVLALVTS
ncbi:MAG: hypothetical protein ACYC7D_12500 [Nitrososphaerales archaeon]